MAGSTGMPLIGVLIPGEAISHKQKSRESGGDGSFTVCPAIHRAAWDTQIEIIRELGTGVWYNREQAANSHEFTKKTKDKQKHIFAVKS